MDLCGFGIGSDKQPQTGDFNGDGKKISFSSLKIQDFSAVPLLLIKEGGFQVYSAYFPFVGKNTDIPIMGDFNADGLIDIGFFNYDNGTWTVKLNDGTLKNFTSLGPISKFGAKRTL